jgi:2-methylcitrate dehydratase
MLSGRARTMANQTTQIQQLAQFALETCLDDLPPRIQQRLKLHILDSLGCAIGALDQEPIRAVRAQIDQLGGSGTCTLIGGGQDAPDRATLCNGSLVRYLDFMDNFLAPKQTCPSERYPGQYSGRGRIQPTQRPPVPRGARGSV